MSLVVAEPIAQIQQDETAIVLRSPQVGMENVFPTQEKSSLRKILEEFENELPHSPGASEAGVRTHVKRFAALSTSSKIIRDKLSLLECYPLQTPVDFRRKETCLSSAVSIINKAPVASIPGDDDQIPLDAHADALASTVTELTYLFQKKLQQQSIVLASKLADADASVLRCESPTSVAGDFAFNFEPLLVKALQPVQATRSKRGAAKALPMALGSKVRGAINASAPEKELLLADLRASEESLSTLRRRIREKLREGEKLRKRQWFLRERVRRIALQAQGQETPNLQASHSDDDTDTLSVSHSTSGFSDDSPLVQQDTKNPAHSTKAPVPSAALAADAPQRHVTPKVPPQTPQFESGASRSHGREWSSEQPLAQEPKARQLKPQESSGHQKAQVFNTQKQVRSFSSSEKDTVKQRSVQRTSGTAVQFEQSKQVQVNDAPQQSPVSDRESPATVTKATMLTKDAESCESKNLTQPSLTPFPTPLSAASLELPSIQTSMHHSSLARHDMPQEISNPTPCVQPAGDVEFSHESTPPRRHSRERRSPNEIPRSPNEQRLPSVKGTPQQRPVPPSDAVGISALRRDASSRRTSNNMSSKGPRQTSSSALDVQKQQRKLSLQPDQPPTHIRAGNPHRASQKHPAKLRGVNNARLSLSSAMQDDEKLLQHLLEMSKSKAEQLLAQVLKTTAKIEKQIDEAGCSLDNDAGLGIKLALNEEAERDTSLEMDFRSAVRNQLTEGRASLSEVGSHINVLTSDSTDNADSIVRSLLASAPKMAAALNGILGQETSKIKKKSDNDSREKKVGVFSRCTQTTGLRSGHSSQAASQPSARSEDDMYRAEELVFQEGFSNLLVAIANITAFYENVEVDLTCSHCLQLQCQPRMLWPCGHTFCARCVEHMHNADIDQYVCTECHRVCEIAPVVNVLLHALIAHRDESVGSVEGGYLRKRLDTLSEHVRAARDEIADQEKFADAVSSVANRNVNELFQQVRQMLEADE